MTRCYYDNIERLIHRNILYSWIQQAQKAGSGGKLKVAFLWDVHEDFSLF